MNHDGRLSQPWEDVTLTLLFMDDGLQERVIHLNRLAAEAEERPHHIANAELSEDDLLIEAAQAWTLEPDEFQQRVEMGVERLLTSPVQITAEDGNSLRLLPPQAVREVRVEVNEGVIIPFPRD